MQVKKIIVIALVALVACNKRFVANKVTYQGYAVATNVTANSKLNSLIKPYADSVNAKMNDVLGEVTEELTKKQPESTLGNFVADAMLFGAKKNYNQQIDASFANFGGIRLNAIPKGKLTRSKIFELSPFDNVLVLQTLTGEQLQQFLNHISGRGGWPAAGISWVIQNKTATNILINGVALNTNANYTIAIVDYVANGGDDCNMLKSIVQKNNGILCRDAIIEYCQNLTRNQQPITATLQNRVSYAK
jgi:2',3'-cyclic-nucleotide 2'-phosphodiesterase (5'-nucleotidase family)